MSLTMLWLDEYAHHISPLHHWEPRCKWIGLMGLILAFSLVRDLRLLPVIMAIALLLYALSRLPFSFLFGRLCYPGIFLLFLAILLPFSSGSTVLWQAGPLALRQEGCFAALLIVIRFCSILTVGLVLFGTAPFATTIKAMQALGVPALLTDMMLLAYRYLYETGANLERMQRAMRMRGFDARHLGKHTLPGLASLVGSLLVRNYEQADRVYKAMVLRGYGCPVQSGVPFQAGIRDVVGVVIALAIAVGLGTAEMLSRRGIW